MLSDRTLETVSREFFEHVLDALIGFLPVERGDFSWRASSRNLKVWFGDDSREHYEVQQVGGALELGFHAEYPDPARNDAVLERLLDGETAWRHRLGAEAESGKYVGRQASVWRRVSEVWKGDALSAPETAVEAADRLAAYIAALEPLRTGKQAARKGLPARGSPPGLRGAASGPEGGGRVSRPPSEPD